MWWTRCEGTPSAHVVSLGGHRGSLNRLVCPWLYWWASSPFSSLVVMMVLGQGPYLAPALVGCSLWSSLGCHRKVCFGQRKGP